MSRNPHKPTDKTKNDVELLVAFGHTHKEIYTYLGIDHKTLLKYYSEELENGHTNKIKEIGNVLYRKALGGDTTSVIFFLKTRGKGKWNTLNVEKIEMENAEMKKEIQEMREMLKKQKAKDY